MTNERDYFLKSQIFKQIFLASVQRNKVYSSEDNNKQLSDFLFNYLENTIKPKYKFPISHELHLAEISNLSEIITKNYSNILYKGKYRIGTAQKILNLYLKYLWCLNEIEEPPHMPIDRLILNELWKIRDKTKNNSILKTNWTELDSIETYANIIILAKSILKKFDVTLSNWEVGVWNKISR
jgi:hypothetical protein